MADVAITWQKIQQGVKETERLLGQKQYNLTMVKARQTLEYMVKTLGERACIVDGDLSDIIDQLYEGQWITKATKDHYHKLRIIGNKAVHEGNDSPSDASQAHHILSQEVYAFANEYVMKKRRPASSTAPRPKGTTTQRTSAKRKRRKRRSPLRDGAQILIPVICVILLIFIIRAILPDKEKEDNTPTETTVPVETTVEPVSQTEETSAETPETTPVETTTAAVIYKATTTLNVRTMPSTNENSQILTQLMPGDPVTVTGTYDAQWTIINYEGQDAYVATAYITQ
ncbi:MAG: DUF4145 domain-containing protein [Lachnospiraceae bacterium]|jgi:hypothetical protein|nr:DUF4145 domain-containing protein [Lachnospiraceae bacterium]